MSELTDKQAKFAKMLGNLLVFASHERTKGPFFGYRVRVDWVFRNKSANSSVSGHSRSLHMKRLAADLIIDRFNEKTQKWVYCTTQTPFHEHLGAFWKDLGGSWGGDFGDPSHFSLPHKGMK